MDPEKTSLNCMSPPTKYVIPKSLCRLAIGQVSYIGYTNPTIGLMSLSPIIWETMVVWIFFQLKQPIKKRGSSEFQAILSIQFTFDFVFNQLERWIFCKTHPKNGDLLGIVESVDIFYMDVSKNGWFIVENLIKNG